jgi:hypothetical protein
MNRYLMTLLAGVRLVLSHFRAFTLKERSKKPTP